MSGQKQEIPPYSDAVPPAGGAGGPPPSTPPRMLRKEIYMNLVPPRKKGALEVLKFIAYDQKTYWDLLQYMREKIPGIEIRRAFDAPSAVGEPDQIKIPKWRDIAVLHVLPEDLKSYKESYVLIDEEPGNRLYYVDSAQSITGVRIADYAIFMQKLTKLLNLLDHEKTLKIRLNPEQLEDLITSNGGYATERPEKYTELEYADYIHLNVQVKWPLALSALPASPTLQSEKLRTHSAGLKSISFEEVEKLVLERISPQILEFFPEESYNLVHQRFSTSHSTLVQAACVQHMMELKKSSMDPRSPLHDLYLSEEERAAVPAVYLKLSSEKLVKSSFAKEMTMKVSSNIFQEGSLVPCLLSQVTHLAVCQDRATSGAILLKQMYPDLEISLVYLTYSSHSDLPVSRVFTDEASRAALESELEKRGISITWEGLGTKLAKALAINSGSFVEIDSSFMGDIGHVFIKIEVEGAQFYYDPWFNPSKLYRDLKDLSQDLSIKIDERSLTYNEISKAQCDRLLFFKNSMLKRHKDLWDRLTDPSSSFRDFDTVFGLFLRALVSIYDPIRLSQFDDPRQVSAVQEGPAVLRYPSFVPTLTIPEEDLGVAALSRFSEKTENEFRQ